MQRFVLRNGYDPDHAFLKGFSFHKDIWIYFLSRETKYQFQYSTVAWPERSLVVSIYTVFQGGLGYICKDSGQ